MSNNETHYSKIIKVSDINVLSDGYQRNRSIAYIDADTVILEVIDNPYSKYNYEPKDIDVNASRHKYAIRLKSIDGKSFSGYYNSIDIGYISDLDKINDFFYENFKKPNKEVRKLSEDLSDTIEVKNNDNKFSEIQKIFEKRRLNLIYDYMNGKHNKHKLEELNYFELNMFDYFDLTLKYKNKDKSEGHIVSIKNNEEGYLKLAKLIGNKDTETIKTIMTSYIEQEELKHQTGYYKENPFNEILEISLKDDKHLFEPVKFGTVKELNNYLSNIYSKMYDFREAKEFSLSILMKNSKGDEMNILPDFYMSIDNGGFNPNVFNILEYLNSKLKYNPNNPKISSNGGKFYIDLSKEEKKYFDNSNKNEKDKSKQQTMK